MSMARFVLILLIALAIMPLKASASEMENISLTPTTAALIKSVLPQNAQIVLSQPDISKPEVIRVAENTTVLSKKPGQKSFRANTINMSDGRIMLTTRSRKVIAQKIQLEKEKAFAAKKAIPHDKAPIMAADILDSPTNQNLTEKVVGSTLSELEPAGSSVKQ